MGQNILSLIYQPAEIFITGYEFDEKELAVKVTCLIPANVFYTAKPIPYVTAENFVRCLSQACYLLAEHALENNVILDISGADFRQAAARYELYYRSLSMVFHKRVPRGEKFVMRLSLKNWREIRRFSRSFIIFTFSNEKAVISGEMSFVYVKDI